MNLDVTEKDFEEFFNLLKVNENKDRIYYFEYRLKLGFFNFLNKDMESNKVFGKLVTWTPEENEHLHLSMGRLYALYEQANTQSPDMAVVLDAE